MPDFEPLIALGQALLLGALVYFNARLSSVERTLRLTREELVRLTTLMDYLDSIGRIGARLHGAPEKS